MEEKRRAGQTSPHKKPTDRPDYWLFVTLVQCALCALAFLLLLLLSRGDSDRANGLRDDFSSLMTRQLQMEDVEAAASAVRDYFTPDAGTVAVMAQPDESTTLPDETTAQTTQPAESTTASSTETTTQPVETQPLENTTAKAKSDAKKSNTKKSGDTPAVKAAAVVSASPKTATITRPVEGGRYSSYYGYRNNPITHQYAMHTGLDIAVPQGTEIRAAYGGTVRLVGEDSRSGKYVTITHEDGYETFYCHCSRTLVSEGSFVSAGDVVACVGSTGWSTGPHLHFEIRKDGAQLDPLQVLEHDV